MKSPEIWDSFGRSDIVLYNRYFNSVRGNNNKNKKATHQCDVRGRQPVPPLCSVAAEPGWEMALGMGMK